MRILFLSGVDVGGAPLSTIELGKQLAARGHDVGVVLGRSTQPSRLYDLFLRAGIKLNRWLGWQGWREALRPFGRRPVEAPSAGPVRLWHVDRPENAVRRALHGFPADVVIANSFPREAMRWLTSDLRRLGIPVALYMREDHSITHLTQSHLRFDVIFANSRRLADAATLAGYRSVYAPSVVDVTAAWIEPTRSCVLMVNPVHENRPQILKLLASQRPDIPCVFQESWPLAEELRGTLERWSLQYSNLEFRPRTEQPSHVYRDARILLATYPSGRPRVVLEAQSNGIPVVARDQPALAEAVGPGGVIIPPHASDADWALAVQALWDNDVKYESLVQASFAHAAREEIQSDAIAQLVENELLGAI